MTQSQWTAVDDYLTGLFFPPDDALDHALESAQAGGLPPINVTAAQGRLLQIMAKAQQARTILEVGTLGGYSTIWLARALPAGGRVVTLEVDPHHAAVAQANLDRAGVADAVEIRVGPAIESLPILAAERFGPIDFAFIDADKQHNADYFEWAMKLARIGTTIVVDNVIRDGRVVDPASDDADVKGTRRFNELLAAEKRVVATEIQTVGSKGYDGFALALVTG
jgi:predicted O-methyltransferase YrrM